MLPVANCRRWRWCDMGSRQSQAPPRLMSPPPPPRPAPRRDVPASHRVWTTFTEWVACIMDTELSSGGQHCACPGEASSRHIRIPALEVRRSTYLGCGRYVSKRTSPSRNRGRQPDSRRIDACYPAADSSFDALMHAACHCAPMYCRACVARSSESSHLRVQRTDLSTGAEPIKPTNAEQGLTTVSPPQMLHIHACVMVVVTTLQP